MKSVADIRQEYCLKELGREDLEDNPISQFDKWWKEALDCSIDEINAMTLCTCNSQGQPAARMVLLKGYDESGFSFFSNYDSHKAQDIEDNNRVALLFFWKELQRQVRIEGFAKKISEKESDIYYNSRPEGSKLGAWASPQSRVIESRKELDEKLKAVREQFKYKEIVRPQNWGGYKVEPHSIEFWQGRESRLHDRFQFARQQNKSGWSLERLAP